MPARDDAWGSKSSLPVSTSPKRLESWRARLVWIGGSVAAIAVVTYLLYIPWLDIPAAFWSQWVRDLARAPL